VTKQNIFVTKPALAPLAEFLPYLEKIWDSGVLSNNGPFVRRFENALKTYLRVDNLAVVSSGTSGLTLACKAFNLKGEVITTPYSFVTASHVLLWNNITPIFVDIEPDSLNLNPDLVENAIGPRTQAIMATQSYGVSHALSRLEEIATANGLTLIFDSASSFGAEYRNRSALNFGDASVVSFHATKVLTTFEGGAVISRSAQIIEAINSMRNFGIENEISIPETGINAKMSEVHAALGLLQLEHFETNYRRRKALADIYIEKLATVPGVRILKSTPHHRPNFAFFPILLEDAFSLTRDQLYNKLARHNINTRRYFFPLLSELPMYRDCPSANPTNLPVATEISKRVLCLPIYSDLSPETVMYICAIIAGESG
jgi:dTDP-4-amino-4,6-dideoxygalactose transaminase